MEETESQDKKNVIRVNEKGQQLCKAIAKSGNPCRSFAVDDEGLCFQHSNDPDIAKKRKESRGKGGRKSRIKMPPIPDTASDIYWVRGVVKATVQGLMEEGGKESREQARAITSTLNTYLKALEHEIKYGTVSEEVKKLKAELERYRQG